MDILHYLLIYIVVILGSVCQGAISMGFGLIAAPILILINPDFVPAPMIMCGLTLSIFVLIKNKQYSDVSALKFSLIGRFIGTFIAIGIIYHISKEIFSIVFGIIILLAVIITRIKANWNLTPGKLFSAGIISGIMATLTSIGSPPMGLLYQNQKGKIIRGTLSGFFTVGAAVSLISLGFVGKVTLLELKLYLTIFPALVIGFWFSKYTIDFLDKGYIRPLILFISSLSALAVILKSILHYTWFNPPLWLFDIPSLY